jgi:hypothetical protein
MVRLARAVLFVVPPAEFLLTVLLLSGVPLPAPVIAVAEVVVVTVFALEAVTAYRLFRAERRAGASRRAAARATVERLVPPLVLRLMEFDTRGTISLFFWVTGRRHGVPPGATPLPYHREQTPAMLIMIFVMVVDTVVTDLLLRAFHVPHALRVIVLVLDVYSVLIVVAILAAGATRPHVLTATELRVRYAAFFDLRIPRAQIATIRLSRNYNERGMLGIENGRLAVPVSNQTNVAVTLTRPITVTRPLGRTAEATTVHFFTDAPEALAAVVHRPGVAPERR